MLQFHVVFVFPFLQLDLILVLVEGLKSKKKKNQSLQQQKLQREDRKHCSRNVASVVPSLILRLCDITLSQSHRFVRCMPSS